MKTKKLLHHTQLLIKKDYSEFLIKIKKIVIENNIKGIVIGNPINMDGSPSPSSQSAKDLAIKFIKRYY